VLDGPSATSVLYFFYFAALTILITYFINKKKINVGNFAVVGDIYVV
jgi:hypothetical protein